MWEKRTLLYCWWESKLVQPLWRRVQRFLKITKNRATIWPCNPNLGHISREKHDPLSDTWAQVFISALSVIVKTWKQPKYPSTEEWTKKKWYIYAIKYYSAIEKNEIMPFAATWMGLDIVILSEASRQRKRNIIWHHLYVESKRKCYKWTHKSVIFKMCLDKVHLLIGNQPIKHQILSILMYKKTAVCCKRCKWHPSSGSLVNTGKRHNVADNKWLTYITFQRWTNWKKKL